MEDTCDLDIQCEATWEGIDMCLAAIILNLIRDFYYYPLHFENKMLHFWFNIGPYTILKILNREHSF